MRTLQVYSRTKRYWIGKCPVCSAVMESSDKPLTVLTTKEEEPITVGSCLHCIHSVTFVKKGSVTGQKLLLNL